MRKLLIKIGLIIQFEYSFDLPIEKVIGLLTNKGNDSNDNWFNKIFDYSNSLSSKDFKLENNKFLINKKRNMNPSSGGGQIKGEIISTDNNKTEITGEVSSNYYEFYFILFAAFILFIMWLPVYLLGATGLKWIWIFAGFLLIVTCWTALFQRYEAKKVKKDFDKFLGQLKN